MKKAGRIAGALLLAAALAGCTKPQDKEPEQLQETQVQAEGEQKETEQPLRLVLPEVSGAEGTNEYSSRLPVIYLNTVQDIKDEYVEAEMSMDGNGQYAGELLYNGKIKIKLRGNSTRYRLKSPYKIKLESKADLFGMGANKHWVLLANDIDHTLIRNKLVYDFAAAIGMEYAPESVLAAVVVNGVYQGVYQFCEHIRIDEERVNVFDWDQLAEKLSEAITAQEAADGQLSEEERKDRQGALEEALQKGYSWLKEPYTFTYEDKTWKLTDYAEIPPVTGGFLLEMDFYALNDPSLTPLTTNFGLPFYFNTPEKVSRKSELYQYAGDYLQAFEYAVHSEDFVYRSTAAHYQGYGRYFDWGTMEWVSEVKECSYTGTRFDGYHYSELFDMDSLVQNFLVCEFTMNWDSMKNSVFVYKDIEGLAKFGPVWDFDWAFGNINMYNIDTWYPEGWQTTNNYFANEQYYQSVQWNRYLIRDPYFVMKVYEKYHKIREGALADAVEAISVYEEWLADDGKRNDIRWRTTYRDPNFYSGKNSEDFTRSFASLKEFVNTRVEWLDAQFKDLDTLMESLGGYEKSELLQIEAAELGGLYTITVQSRVPGCTSVAVQINGTYQAAAELSEGKAVVTVPAERFTSEGNMITVFALDSAGAFLHVNEEAEAAAVSSYYYLQ